MTTELSAWATRVRETVSLIERASGTIADLLSMPEVSPADLPTLNALWVGLGLTSSQDADIEQRGVAFEGRLKVESSQARHELHRLLHRVLDARIHLYQAGAVDPSCPMIRHRDFPPGSLLEQAEHPGV